MLKLVDIKDLPEKYDLYTFYKNLEHGYHESKAKELGYSNTENAWYTRDSLDKHLGEENWYHKFIIRQDNIIGIIVYVILPSTHEKDECCYIDALYIDQAHRHKGYMTYIIKDILSKEFEAIELNVWYEIPAKVKYKNLGFNEIFTRMVYKSKISEEGNFKM